MFNKHDVESRWPEYLYRELEDPEQARFVQAIQTDPELEAEEKQWRELLSQFDMISTLDNELEVPQELVFRVKRQISLYQDWNAQTWSHLRRWAAASIAACFLVLFLGWSFMKPLSAFDTEKGFYQPLREHVLSVIYDRSVLKIYRAEGVIENRDEAKNLVQSPLSNSEDKEEQEKASIKKDPAL